MKKKIDRIASFIEALPPDSEIGVENVMEINLIAGSQNAITNADYCVNAASCIGSVNEKVCYNYKLCGNSANAGGCYTGKLPNNPCTGSNSTSCPVS